LAQKVKIFLVAHFFIMHVLLTNDDGIHAPGLWSLYRPLAERHTVTVVAPDRECSAVGHAITLHQPLRATRVSVNNGCRGYAVSGTPADCVKLGIMEIIGHRPDIVIAGINAGANVGANLNYSGTVAAAKEAALCGTAGIAVSVEVPGADFCDDVADLAARLCEAVAEKGLPFGSFVNINLPACPAHEIRGVRVSRQAVVRLNDTVDKRTDPRSRTYYWQGPDSQTFADDSEIDGAILGRRYISITPVKCDMTDYRLLEDMKAWGLDRFIKEVPKRKRSA
jgi:5'-nucleotidase